MERLTIDQIAELAFVSRSVVSRVLNDHPNVSDEARARVQRVIAERNYTPSAVARSLATHRTHEISLLVPRRADEVLADPFWSMLFLGVTEGARARGYLVSLSVVTPQDEVEINERILRGHRFDGFILLNNEVARLLLPPLQKGKHPVVLIGHNPDHDRLNWVDVDNTAGARQAVQHLVDLGHRRIATITGPLHMQEAKDRRLGYHRALQAAGLPLEEAFVVEGDYTHQGGYTGMQRLLEARPTAVFCASDAMAAGALLALHEAGRAVPDEVSVVGYDDLPFAAFMMPPLTTVRQPIHAIGAQAAALLIDRIEDRAGQQQQILPTELILRQSTAPPPRAD